eukprot:COSAG01_NODE_2775_length_7095_cov_4.918811_5_plen_86_part_00
MEMCAYSKLMDTAKLVFEDMKLNGTSTHTSAVLVGINGVFVEVVPDTISYNAFVQAIIQEDDELFHIAPTRQYRCVECRIRIFLA